MLTKLTHSTKPTHTHTRTLQNMLKQPQYKLQQPQFKIYVNETVTIQSSTLSISSPYCTGHFYPQELHLNSLHLN
jgi:predicted nucleic acid binding AN1-type Zn finger protein